MPKRWQTRTAQTVLEEPADTLQPLQDLLAAHTLPPCFSGSAQAALMKSSHPTAYPRPKELEQVWFFCHGFYLLLFIHAFQARYWALHRPSRRKALRGFLRTSQIFIVGLRKFVVAAVQMQEPEPSGSSSPGAARDASSTATSAATLQAVAETKKESCVRHFDALWFCYSAHTPPPPPPPPSQGRNVSYGAAASAEAKPLRLCCSAGSPAAAVLPVRQRR